MNISSALRQQRDEEVDRQWHQLRNDVRQRFQAVGFDLVPNTMSDHAIFLRQQLDAWGKRIKDAGLRAE